MKTERMANGSTPGCTAFHPDCPMVCVLPAGHDGDHSTGRMSASWQGRSIRTTWPQSDGDEAPAIALRQRAAYDALDEVLFRCVDVGLSRDDVLSHIAGHEISESTSTATEGADNGADR